MYTWNLIIKITSSTRSRTRLINFWLGSSCLLTSYSALKSSKAKMYIKFFPISSTPNIKTMPKIHSQKIVDSLTSKQLDLARITNLVTYSSQWKYYLTYIRKNNMNTISLFKTISIPKEIRNGLTLSPSFIKKEPTNLISSIL